MVGAFVLPPPVPPGPDAPITVVVERKRIVRHVVRPVHITLVDAPAPLTIVLHEVEVRPRRPWWKLW